MVKKIVSHLPPRHMDDWMAIAMLKMQYPEAEIEYVHPQKVSEEYKERNDIALIDVGGSYDVKKNNFDHHQDINLPCSLSLILRELYPELENSPAVKVIDFIDRFGFPKAKQEGLIEEDQEADRLRKIILMTKPDRAGMEVLTALKKNLNLNDTTKELYKLLKEKGLTKEAEETLENEMREFLRKAQNAEITEAGKFKIAFSKESLSSNHKWIS